MNGRLRHENGRGEGQAQHQLRRGEEALAEGIESRNGQAEDGEQLAGPIQLQHQQQAEASQGQGQQQRFPHLHRAAGQRPLPGSLHQAVVVAVG